MSRENSTPVGRGETFYNGTVPSNAATDDAMENYLGRTVAFEDIKYGDRGVKANRTGQRQVVCRLVRNMSGQTLYASRLVQLDPTNPNHVLGYATTLAQEAYPVDEFLPASGVANYDCFYIVIKGPALILLPMTGAEFQTASIAAGAVLVGGTTSAASTAAGTTGSAGRISGFTIVAATTTAQIGDILNYATNNIGRAMSAATSGQTNSSLLVDVNRDKGGYP